MRLLDSVRARIAAHACRQEPAPIPRNRGAELSDDDREFDTDMTYLYDLLTVIVGTCAETGARVRREFYRPDLFDGMGDALEVMLECTEPDLEVRR